MSVLEVRSLRVKLGGKLIIDDTGFTASGKITALLGRNGSGKSTLIKAILGLIPASGKIYLDGNALGHMSDRAKAGFVSYLPQRQMIPSGMKVLDYVAMGTGGIFSPPDKDRLSKAHAELCRLNIADTENRYMDTLSGGEARLAGLARARAQQSRLMLMDEPLAGLDFVRQHEFMQQLKQDDRSVLMSLHDPLMAWQYADEIIMIENGHTICCDTKDEATFQQLLNRLYGQNLRFEQAGNMRLPLWHDI